ncbi:MAG: hypothetical protein KJ749_10890, partial [Planctomycetes bacterium]|nr:hypothetical protein [Planctomycetota bacterium]
MRPGPVLGRGQARLLSHRTAWYPETMLRRVLIVVLSATAAGTGLLWILSYLPPAGYDYLGEHA